MIILKTKILYIQYDLYTSKIFIFFNRLSGIGRYKPEINDSEGSDDSAKSSPKCMKCDHSIDKFMSSESRYTKFKYSCYECYRKYYKHDRDSYKLDKSKYYI